MYKLVGILLLFTLFTYCTEDPVKFRSRNTIPKNDFVSILVEMHLMDVMTNHHAFYNKYSSKDSLDIYGYIFEKYGYSRVEFDSTVSNYTRNPVLYERVYNDVMLKLNYILDTLQKNDPKFENNGMEIKKTKDGTVF